MSLLSKRSRLVLLAVMVSAIVGCQSAEEKANEEAVKSRDAQAAQMGGHGAPPAGGPPGGAMPPSSPSATGN